MTTDASTQPPPDAATQARLAALRERQGAAQGANRPAAGERPRRRHAATGARIFAGSLSASAALGLMALMAGVDPGATVAESPDPSPPQPVVIVVRSSTGATLTSTASPTVAAAPLVAASTAPPVTSSQAS